MKIDNHTPILTYYNRLMAVCESSKIEGSTFSFDDTLILFGIGVVNKDTKLDDVDMVRDHYTALELVLETVKNKNDISIEWLQKVNALVKKNTGAIGNNVFGDYDTSSGMIRRVSVRAGNTQFMDAQKVPQHLDKLVVSLEEHKSLKNEKDIREFAWKAHYNLVTIHPFMDGNGRTSRLLMNYIEAYHGLDLTIVLSKNKDVYIEAMEKIRENEDFEPYFTVMRSNRKEADTLVKKYIKANTIIGKSIKSNHGMGFFII